MREFLIEVPHSPEECSDAGVGAATAGTTYCGCSAGTHTNWIIATLATDDEAWGLVPKLWRDTARVVPVTSSAEPFTEQPRPRQLTPERSKR